jgi:hypothetical protein
MGYLSQYSVWIHTGRQAFDPRQRQSILPDQLSEVHPASYPVGTGGTFPRGKAWLGRNADYSPPSSAVVKNK